MSDAPQGAAGVFPDSAKVHDPARDPDFTFVAPGPARESEDTFFAGIAHLPVMTIGDCSRLVSPFGFEEL